MKDFLLEVVKGRHHLSFHQRAKVSVVGINRHVLMRTKDYESARDVFRSILLAVSLNEKFGGQPIILQSK